MDQEDQARPWFPRFALIWGGQQFSLFGSALAQFALVWWLTQTTHSATVLATATMVAVLPAVFLGPFVGALVDRWNRRIVMIVADGTVALAAMFCTGVMNPIINGPVMALMQTLVPPEMQGRVFTVIQSVAAAMSPLGLAIAGPVADALGVRSWYLLGGLVCMLMGAGAFLVPAIVHIEDGRERKAAAVTEA